VAARPLGHVNRLDERVGRVTIDQQWKVDAALPTMLGLD
jgi:hypothetical protein